MYISEAVKTLKQNFKCAKNGDIICKCEHCGKHFEVSPTTAADYIRFKEHDGSGKRLTCSACGERTLKPMYSALRW